MESAISISNYFIKKSVEEEIPLTPMKLLKLAYIAHGWHLGLKDTALINEQIVAWKYGPVIPDIYHTFKSYGNSPITELATEYDFDNGFKEITPLPSESENEFLNNVWDFYKRYSAIELSYLTHQEDTPWDIVWNKNGGKNKSNAPISDVLIQKHYKEKIASNN